MRLGLKELAVVGTLALGGCDGSKQHVPESQNATPGTVAVQDVRQLCRAKMLAAQEHFRNFWEANGIRIDSWDKVYGMVERECLEEHGVIGNAPAMIERQDDGHGLNGTY